MKAYISGKITGIPIEEATDKFKAMELLLSFHGIEVVNPMELVPYHPDKTWEEYMIADLSALFTCDCIVMLDNWRDSRGARIEHAIAVEMGMHIGYPGHRMHIYNSEGVGVIFNC